MESLFFITNEARDEIFGAESSYGAAFELVSERWPNDDSKVIVKAKTEEVGSWTAPFRTTNGLREKHF